MCNESEDAENTGLISIDPQRELWFGKQAEVRLDAGEQANDGDLALDTAAVVVDVAALVVDLSTDDVALVVDLVAAVASVVLVEAVVDALIAAVALVDA